MLVIKHVSSNSYVSSRPVTRGLGGLRPSEKLFAPQGKCVGHSLKNVDLCQKTLRPHVSQADYGPDQQTWNLFLNLLISFLLLYSEFPFSRSTFVLSLIWPEFMISVISGTRHTVFSQHAWTTTFTTKLGCFLTDALWLE